MKRVIIFLISGLFIITPEFSNAATSFDSKAAVSVKKETGKGRKKKNGRYKRKKGFMWGLFGSKKQCDCPKH